MARIIFKEQQRFTQWWIWFILLGILCVPIYGMYQQFYLGVPFGDRPMSNMGLIFFALGICSLVVLFYLMRLHTYISEQHFHFKYFPFLSRTYNWDEIASIEIVTYPFSGYGIRLWTSYGTLYNTNGSTGIAVVLKNGNRFCIGTQKGEEVRRVLEKLKENSQRETI